MGDDGERGFFASVGSAMDEQHRAAQRMWNAYMSGFVWSLVIERAPEPQADNVIRFPVERRR